MINYPLLSHKLILFVTISDDGNVSWLYYIHVTWLLKAKLLYCCYQLNCVDTSVSWKTLCSSELKSNILCFYVLCSYLRWGFKLFTFLNFLVCSLKLYQKTLTGLLDQNFDITWPKLWYHLHFLFLLHRMILLRIASKLSTVCEDRIDWWMICITQCSINYTHIGRN